MDSGARRSIVKTERVVLAGVLLMLSIAVGGCRVRDRETEYVSGEAVVETIEIAILESFPVQVRAVLRGSLPDACTKIESVAQQLGGNTFTLVVRTQRPADVACAQVITPYETTTGLDVLGLPAGTYAVVAGEARAGFELLVDNTPQSEP